MWYFLGSKWRWSQNKSDPKKLNSLICILQCRFYPKTLDRTITGILGKYMSFSHPTKFDQNQPKNVATISISRFKMLVWLLGIWDSISREINRSAFLIGLWIQGSMNSSCKRVFIPTTTFRTPKLFITLTTGLTAGVVSTLKLFITLTTGLTAGVVSTLTYIPSKRSPNVSLYTPVGSF